MRLAIAAAPQRRPSRLARPAPRQRRVVEIKDAVARVTVIPEDRTRHQGRGHQPPTRALPLEVRTPRRRHHHRRRPRPPDPRAATARRATSASGCAASARSLARHAPGRDPHARATSICAGGAVFGPSAAPPAWTSATPAAATGRSPTSSGQLRLSQAGSGDTRAGAAGERQAARGRLGRHRRSATVRGRPGRRHRRLRRRHGVASVDGPAGRACRRLRRREGRRRPRHAMNVRSPAPATSTSAAWPTA